MLVVHQNGEDPWTTVYRFLTSPRVITFFKWAAISGVSMGVCAVTLHYYVRSQNNALRDALQCSIDAVKSAIDKENSVLIGTVETQSQIIKAEQETIATLFASLERRASSENETIQNLLETIQKLTEQNAKSIEQLTHHQKLASAAIEVAKKTGESGTSIEKKIGEGVTWVVGKGVGAVRGLFGW